MTWLDYRALEIRHLDLLIFDDFGDRISRETKGLSVDRCVNMGVLCSSHRHLDRKAGTIQQRDGSRMNPYSDGTGMTANYDSVIFGP